MSRRDDWVEKLWGQVEDHFGSPFEWGVNDCCLFAARVVDAMTDGAFEVELQSQYSDEATALAYIASHGSLEAAVTSHLGNPAEGRAQRGDVVICANSGNPCVGVCVGGAVACVGQSGLVFLPRQDIITRWAI